MSMDTHNAISLSGGYSLDGENHRTAEIHPVTGAEETFIHEFGDSLYPVELATALLTRCTSRIGPVRSVHEDIIRDLIIGDRERLLLNLRLLTLGDRIECNLECPSPDCGKKMDLELSIGNLLPPPVPVETRNIERDIQVKGLNFTVIFRLPTVRDLEFSVLRDSSGPVSSSEHFFRNCIQELHADSKASISMDELDSTIRTALRSELVVIMKELDPMSEITLRITCPNCGHEFSSTLDPTSIFTSEIRNRARMFYKEVHTLAFHYHWSESDIISMTSKKRRLYLDLLTDYLSGD